MDTRKAYDLWAAQYDTNENKTRDLEAIALREQLATIPFQRCLELGCGTGKNTSWLMQHAAHVSSVDYSEKMLDIAREKIRSPRVAFIQADLQEEWAFVRSPYDLVTFSLVLEHIRDLAPVFAKAAAALNPGGYLYAGELHPFKQYAGSKARFETEHGTQEVICFIHHLSDFTTAASENSLSLRSIREYFDDRDTTTIPRIISFVFQKL